LKKIFDLEIEVDDIKNQIKELKEVFYQITSNEKLRIFAKVNK
jgi:hypothetical protein